MGNGILMQMYDCIVCKERVACTPNCPKDKRYCNSHTKQEVADALLGDRE